jgi:hypothetical protein
MKYLLILLLTLGMGCSLSLEQREAIAQENARVQGWQLFNAQLGSLGFEVDFLSYRGQVREEFDADWFYDFGYNFIGYVDNRQDPLRYGAYRAVKFDYIYTTPETLTMPNGELIDKWGTRWHWEDPLSPYDGYFNHYEELIFYTQGLAYSFYQNQCPPHLYRYHEGFPCNEVKELVWYYFRLEEGKFYQEENSSLLGTVLYHYDFSQPEQFLASTEQAKIAQWKQQEVIYRPRISLATIGYGFRFPGLVAITQDKTANTYLVETNRGYYYRVDLEHREVYFLGREWVGAEDLEWFFSDKKLFLS